MPKKPDKKKKRRAGSAVPPEVALALQYGAHAYRHHSSWEVEPDEVCLSTFLLCGRLHREKAVGRQLWAKHRSDLLKRKGIKTWWGYGEYEKRNTSKRVE